MPTKRNMIRAAPIVFAALALAICLARQANAAAPEPPAGPEASDAHRQALERQVRAWIDALSSREPFQDWADAETRIDPLGPGTHGWLVTLTARSSRAPVGYLVAYSDPDREGGFRLGEYGAGAHPLYGEPTLRRTLEANGYLPPSGRYAAVKAYRHPFAAAWKVRIGEETYWLDAKTGEELPLDDRAWAQSAGGDPADGVRQVPALAQGESVSAVHLNEPFNPYDRLPWLTGEAALAAEPAAPLLGRLEQGLSLRFVAEPFGERMLYAVPVIGYASWSGGRIDLALDQCGPRFVPIDVLRELGTFYK